jgi:hypothetical protein
LNISRVELFVGIKPIRVAYHVAESQLGTRESFGTDNLKKTHSTSTLKKLLHDSHIAQHKISQARHHSHRSPEINSQVQYRSNNANNPSHHDNYTQYAATSIATIYNRQTHQLLYITATAQHHNSHSTTGYNISAKTIVKKATKKAAIAKAKQQHNARKKI